MTTATLSKFPQIRTALPGPKGQQVIAYDAKYISPSLSRDYPLVAERASGAIVEDPDGNSFLDFAAGIAVCSTGHCHPNVVAAIQKQAAELIHIAGTDFYHRHMPQLAERLVATMPKSHQWKVFFGNSGTEAVEGAIKLARYATKRDKLIAFYGCFHGRTLGSLSLTASKSTQRKYFGTLLGGVEHIPYPYAYRCGLGHTKESCGSEVIDLLENQIFKRLFAPEETAAVVVEPIQGEGGFIPAPITFLQELQRICNKHGIMLIMDEVQAGVGRTGKMWAYDHAGVTPDIVLTAKGVASGMPLSAFIAKEEVMRWKPGSHGTTYGGNPVCVASALATLDLVEGGLMANANKVGDHIFSKTADWTNRFKIVGDVRGKGLMIGVEFVRDQNTKERGPDLRDKVVQAAFRRGLLVLGSGENSIRMSPPLIIDEEQADCAIAIMEDSIREVEQGL
ncbi:MAG TPA: acetyl ornithine aminotransferase family protein [Candidatus Saccharimonadales bacterium]|nr:acetyl ornithine aminotransferase family protein [Candidatus Saccharimonadales bacterium]